MALLLTAGAVLAPPLTARFAQAIGAAVSTSPAGHVPVLLAQVVELLAWHGPGPGVLVDATVGAGGHSAALLEASSPETLLVGLDRDPDALGLAGERLAVFGSRAVLVHAASDRLAEVVAPLAAAHGPVVGVLMDLGVSSMQLDQPGRGFSFRLEGPLDMRMDPTTGETAAELVNTVDRVTLERLLRANAEERFAGRIARAIVERRPFTTTTRLAEVIAEAVPAAARSEAHRAGIHPATRTFQALRIAVNDELGRLSASLPQALGLLARPSEEAARRGGRAVVLAYHSLEDRSVKRAFSDALRGCICPPDLPVCGCGRVPLVRPVRPSSAGTGKPDLSPPSAGSGRPPAGHRPPLRGTAATSGGVVRPDPAEVAANPRARSARLRAVERTAAAEDTRWGLA